MSGGLPVCQQIGADVRFGIPMTQPFRPLRPS